MRIAERTKIEEQIAGMNDRELDAAMSNAQDWPLDMDANQEDLVWYEALSAEYFSRYESAMESKREAMEER